MPRFVELSKNTAIPNRPGYYIVRSGECISHIGTSRNLRSRVRTLISLRNHRGSDEVLCVAYCTRSAPEIAFAETKTDVEARAFESRLKKRYGEPPCPREGYEKCARGNKLKHDLISAAGSNTKEAGYIEAVFDVGEQFYRIVSDPRFDNIWKRLGGRPPGPWCKDIPST